MAIIYLHLLYFYCIYHYDSHIDNLFEMRTLVTQKNTRFVSKLNVGIDMTCIYIFVKICIYTPVSAKRTLKIKYTRTNLE